MNTSLDQETITDFLQTESSPTSNSLDLTPLNDSSVLTPEVFPSSKRLRMFKQSSHCNFLIFI